MGVWPVRQLRFPPGPGRAVELAHVARDLGEMRDGGAEPALRLDRLLRKGGFRVSQKPLPGNHMGLLLGSRGGFWIVIDKDKLSAAAPPADLADLRRFIIAHEIAHSLFATSAGSAYGERYGGTFRDLQEEYFCDVFAAALLSHNADVGDPSMAAVNYPFAAPRHVQSWAADGFPRRVWQTFVFPRSRASEPAAKP